MTHTLGVTILEEVVEGLRVLAVSDEGGWLEKAFGEELTVRAKAMGRE